MATVAGWSRAGLLPGLSLCVLGFGFVPWLGHASKGISVAGPARSSTPAPARPAALGVTSKLPELAARAAVATILIPKGEYTPFFKNPAEPEKISVQPFLLDRVAVTRVDYRDFVIRHPSWRKSQVKALFAESSYLSDWPSDVDPGPAEPEAPVGFVSWFAAKAYCAALGKRLPSVVEWESFAQTELGSQLLGLSRVEAGSIQPVLPKISEWISDFNSALVSGGAPGEDATSLFCGAGARATDARDYQAFLRYSFRSSLKANFALKRLGFRCAKDAP